MRTLVLILLMMAWAEVTYCSKVRRFRATQSSLRVMLKKNKGNEIGFGGLAIPRKAMSEKKTKAGLRLKAVE